MATTPPPAPPETRIGPQVGPQTAFLSSPADIAIYGGSAGGGKTFGLLLECCRHSGNGRFGAVIFRRETPQITNEGGLWDESEELFPMIGGLPSKSALRWVCPSGMSVKFAHMEDEKDRYKWQGSQIPLICWDELTHFTEKQFWYMLSRSRSSCNVRPYIRATCNPDPKSFVTGLISWYIDQTTGLAIPERSGVIRWFIREDDELIWADSKQGLIDAHPGSEPKSFTFIRSSVYDNKILLKNDPAYLANLKAQTRVDRARLLDGNWLIEETAGEVFLREWFPVVDAVPKMIQTVRFWDRAGTEPSKTNPNPDWTRGGLIGRGVDGLYYILHMHGMRKRPFAVRQAMLSFASQDGHVVKIGIFKDPGSAGIDEAESALRDLAGYSIEVVGQTKDKVTRSKPFAIQAEAGNVRLLRGDWNEDLLKELQNFPDGRNDDQVDVVSAGFLLVAAAQPFAYQSVKVSRGERLNSRSISL